MKRYDQKFKEEALKLSDDIGLKKACEQLNLNYGTLSGWRKQRVRKNRAGLGVCRSPFLSYRLRDTSYRIP